ncbi:MAG: Flp family type IVb pilin [Acidimicrobiales bacterium]
MFAYTAFTNFVAFIQGRLQRDHKGAALVEYALLVALIAAAAIVILTVLGKSISHLFGGVNNAIGNVTVGQSGS